MGCLLLQVRANEAAHLLAAALPLLLSGHAAAQDIVVMNAGLWHFDEEEYRCLQQLGPFLVPSGAWFITLSNAAGNAQARHSAA